MLVVTTSQPAALLEKLKELAADESEEGLAFWYVDDDGDFGYLPPDAEGEVEDQGWLRCIETQEDALIFETIWPEGLPPDAGVYGFLNSQFLEMLLAVFPQALDAVSVYPLV